jgi:hypothetical protein
MPGFTLGADQFEAKWIDFRGHRYGTALARKGNTSRNSDAARRSSVRSKRRRATGDEAERFRGSNGFVRLECASLTESVHYLYV